MADVMQTPNTSDTGTSVGWILGLIIAAILIFLLFAYGLPFLRGTRPTTAPLANTPAQITPGGANAGIQGRVPLAPTSTTSSVSR